MTTSEDGRTSEGTYNIILRYFKVRMPIFIITKANMFMGGYLANEPKATYCIILDYKQNRLVRIGYDEIYIIKDWRGPAGSLPIPGYIQRELHGVNSPDASNSEKTEEAHR